MSEKRIRNWCFTLNNYTSEEEDIVKAWKCRYLIFGHEVGEKGTPHLQGYVSFASAKTWDAMKKFCPQRMSFRVAKGDADQNEEYCSKDATDVFEKGTKPISQVEKGALGKRSFEEAYSAYKEKRYEDMGKFALQMKQFDYFDDKVRKRDRNLNELSQLKNEWHWGVPGSGKSETRYEHPDRYMKKTNKWWDGYTNQKVVFIDEFSKKHMTDLLDDLKEWTGEHSFQAETKGGQMEIRSEMTIVTSQHNPSTMVSGPDWDAINRRFKIYYWGEPYFIDGRRENGLNPKWYDPRKT